MLQPTSSQSGPLRVVQAVGELDDVALVERCVRGDAASLRSLFERERFRVHALLFRMIGSNTPLDDLVQEAFLEVFRSLPTFRGESSLRTWIDRCVVRVGYGYFRRKARTPTLECLSDATISPAPDAEERAVWREAVRRLYAELERLEPHQRVAFTLFAIDGLSLREVADAMESSLVSAKVRVWRARRAIEKRAKHDHVLTELLSGTFNDQEGES